MKKILMTFVILGLLLGAILAALLVGTGPENANSKPVTIELPDSFEK